MRRGPSSVVMACVFGLILSTVPGHRLSAQENENPGQDAGSEEFREVVQRALVREAQYRAIDYAALPFSEYGYLKALQRAEQNATLSALYRYTRYQRGISKPA